MDHKALVVNLDNLDIQDHRESRVIKDYQVLASLASLDPLDQLGNLEVLVKMVILAHLDCPLKVKRESKDLQTLALQHLKGVRENLGCLE